ncbi:hypothetical protein [Polaribacter sargassicola]|uniref:hypothetical protein n=1 Tax=Polaribacter sargassicola TaxID=2836891 RepID=UPI001F1E8AB4|nr:hypothetical protein [Polaribacter sp. DS7-9]MCG1035236.1 hypothetical protein [Polaribacter sp. DS7-9]
MKNFITPLATLLITLTLTINSYAQDIAMVEIEETETEIFDSESSYTALQNGTYSYKLGSEEIKVSIEGGYYTEHHPNNEFIKAKINWVAADEYTLTIVDLKKDNLPFKAGTKLSTKITKVKGDKYYYESDLLGSNQSTWTGKFKKLD